MIKYIHGLIFNNNKSHVLLIEYDEELFSIGGEYINDTDNLTDIVSKKVKLDIKPHDWTFVVKTKTKYNREINYYKCILSKNFSDINFNYPNTLDNDGQLKIISVNDLHNCIIHPSLKWVIPMCFDTTILNVEK
jgi:hypothetical protein